MPALGGRLGGGDDGADDDGSAAPGLEAQLGGEPDIGLHVGRVSTYWLRVAWSCLWQQLGAVAADDDGLATWWGRAIRELRNAERCEREKVGSGGIEECKG